MSENLQHLQGSSSPSPRPHHQKRPDKQASSCTECRRRKQKCSQGQPCTNCARRFPQPICDYETKTKGRGGPRTSDTLAAKTVSKEGPYPHLNLAGVQDALLQLEHQPNGAVSKGEDELSPIVYGTAGRGADSPSGPEHDQFMGHVRNWLPFRLVSHRGYARDNLHFVLEVLRSILERSYDSPAQLSPRDEWILDAAQLIWTAQGGCPAPTPSLQKMEQELQLLPMAPTKLNKELVRTHLRLLSRFKASVSGIPDPDNPFMKHWVPSIIQDPLLLNTVLFTSACFLNETGHLPKPVVVALRSLVYQSLNDRLRSPESQTSDTAILAVADMVLDEWYWGRTQDLCAHMTGLRAMIRMRGGLKDLGMHGYIAKMIIIHDVCIALGHETQPEIYGQPGFEFDDPVMVPLQLSLNSPLSTGWPSFASCASSLQLHPYTAIILDDVRLMVHTVLSLSEHPTPQQQQYVSAIVAQTCNRIEQLPESVRVCRPRPGNASTSASSPESDSPHSRTDGTQSTVMPLSTDNETSPAGGSSLGDGVRGSSPISSDLTSRNPPLGDIPDTLYSMVRMTAAVLCRAVARRTPTSLACSPAEVTQIWDLSYRIPMPMWTSILGIYLWTMLTIAPSCHATAPARFIKTQMVNGFLTAAVENWHVAIDAARTALQLQQWLRGFEPPCASVIGGEGTIEKHGFAAKEVLRHIAEIRNPLNGQEEGDDEDVVP